MGEHVRTPGMGRGSQPWHPSPTGEAGTQQPSTWLTPASWDLRACAFPEGASPLCPALPVHRHLLPSLPHRIPQALFISKVFFPSPFSLPAPSHQWVPPPAMAGTEDSPPMAASPPSPSPSSRLLHSTEVGVEAGKDKGWRTVWGWVGS